MPSPARFPDLKIHLDHLYLYYNARSWVHPDPLEFLYHYPDLKDREIAGLIASSLAYGRVDQILKTVSSVLEALGPSPCTFLKQGSPGKLKSRFKGFKYRFTTGRELVLLLTGIRQVIDTHGSLQACFLNGFNPRDETPLSGLCFLTDALRTPFGNAPNSLIPDPRQGSACKRLNLFMRWMVRRDGVDPGGWDQVPRSKLIIPLDIHMHRVSLVLALTRRQTAGMHTAREVTQAFRRLSPEDPVRYDFALTRLGIRKDEEMCGFLDRCRVKPKKNT